MTASAGGVTLTRAAQIDATGTLPDGTQFQGPAGLRQLLLTKYKDDFVRTATEKLLTYALGRGLEYYDYPTVRAIARDAVEGRLSHLVPRHRRREQYAVSDAEGLTAMNILHNPLPRRTFLRGLGATDGPPAPGFDGAVSRRRPAQPARHLFVWATSTGRTAWWAPVTRARAPSCGRRRLPGPASSSVPR